MANALFYVLTADTAGPAALACQAAARAYRKGQRVYLHCASQADAEALDEQLWQFEPDSFIPHNLVGEGPRGGAPVEIGWDTAQASSPTNRPLLINLAPEVPNFAVQFAHIIDFVPADEQAKAQARRRFAHYRHLGVTLTTQDLARQPF
ncbi:DNA polymerase III subunit chi [Ferrimonas balearica]|uniref:DNA polymerase III subunit chi n=1 Tax=Ferrimonas balearica TaxID=44012 RepID=UPI001C990C72|nr:DNA polymerase III subunit chi [Ferrimonas balearica]MBY5993697.1 DNA polymerase III subunit chi [Ferrimonas balearica]